MYFFHESIYGADLSVGVYVNKYNLSSILLGVCKSHLGE